MTPNEIGNALRKRVGLDDWFTIPLRVRLRLVIAAGDLLDRDETGAEDRL